MRCKNIPPLFLLYSQLCQLKRLNFFFSLAVVTSMNPGKQKNWKLLIDPFLIKGSVKTVRYEGLVPGDPTYPMVQLRDPRTQRPTNRWSRLDDVLDLPVPRFRVSIHHFLPSFCFIFTILSTFTDRLQLCWGASCS